MNYFFNTKAREFKANCVRIKTRSNAFKPSNKVYATIRGLVRILLEITQNDTILKSIIFSSKELKIYQDI